MRLLKHVVLRQDFRISGTHQGFAVVHSDLVAGCSVLLGIRKTCVWWDMKESSKQSTRCPRAFLVFSSFQGLVHKTGVSPQDQSNVWVLHVSATKARRSPRKHVTVLGVLPGFATLFTWHTRLARVCTVLCLALQQDRFNKKSQPMEQTQYSIWTILHSTGMH